MNDYAKNCQRCLLCVRNGGARQEERRGVRKKSSQSEHRRTYQAQSPRHSSAWAVADTVLR